MVFGSQNEAEEEVINLVEESDKFLLLEGLAKT